MDPFTLITWIVFDSIIIAGTSYLSLLLWAGGALGDALANSWLEIIVPLLLGHIVAFISAGLYRSGGADSYLRVLVRTIKGSAIAVLLTMAFAYFVRGSAAMVFPAAALIIMFFINLIVVGGIRLTIKRANDNHAWINHKVEECIWRGCEAVLINLGFLIAFPVRFHTLDYPEPDLSYYRGFLWVPVTLCFLLGVVASRLHEVREDDWFGRIIWRSAKTGIIGTILSLVVGWLMIRDYSLSGSLYIYGGFFSTLLLAIWHLYRRRYNWTEQLEVDIFAVDEDDEAETW